MVELEVGAPEETGHRQRRYVCTVSRRVTEGVGVPSQGLSGWE